MTNPSLNGCLISVFPSLTQCPALGRSSIISSRYWQQDNIMSLAFGLTQKHCQITSCPLLCCVTLGRSHRVSETQSPLVCNGSSHHTVLWDFKELVREKSLAHAECLVSYSCCWSSYCYREVNWPW